MCSGVRNGSCSSSSAGAVASACSWAGSSGGCLYPADWDKVASDVVAILRTQAGRDPYDRDLSNLVGELSTRSELFRTLWAAHNVRTHDTGTKHMHHPLVGELDLSFEAMELVADPGLTMFVHTAEPASKAEQALNLLASWAATPDQETADAHHQEQPRHERRT